MADIQTNTQTGAPTGFVGLSLHSQVYAPLDDPERRVFLDPDDQDTLAALTNPASPHYILQRPDLHLLSGVSLFVGWV